MTLRLHQVRAGHGAADVLRGLSFAIGGGEIVGLMGRNGAGKTTALRTILGLVETRGGTIMLDDAVISGLSAHEVPRRGVAYVPQGRRLFNAMTVEDNLRMGLALRGSGEEVRERVLTLFPILRQRLRQIAGTLSGGEQQMLATARALCTEPRVLLLDEPSEGLVPEIVHRILATLVQLKEQDVAILLVEQKVKSALAVCDRILLLEDGVIQHEGTATALAADPLPLERYIGVHR